MIKEETRVRERGAINKEETKGKKRTAAIGVEETDEMKRVSRLLRGN